MCMHGQQLGAWNHAPVHEVHCWQIFTIVRLEDMGLQHPLAEPSVQKHTDVQDEYTLYVKTEVLSILHAIALNGRSLIYLGVHVVHVNAGEHEGYGQELLGHFGHELVGRVVWAGVLQAANPATVGHHCSVSCRHDLRPRERPTSRCACPPSVGVIQQPSWGWCMHEWRLTCQHAKVLSTNYLHSAAGKPR